MIMVFQASGDIASEIDRIAKKKNISKADVLRRAMELYFLALKMQGDFNERRIAIVEGNKIIEKYVLL